MGGDEFAVLLPAGTAEAAEALAEVLLSALHEPLHALVEPWPLRASAGVSRCSETVCSVERLVRRAERAMYRAKEAGGSQYAVATEEPTTPPNSNSHD
jgi:diguanylate cyclase (GGDEF)-like protein